MTITTGTVRRALLGLLLQHSPRCGSSAGAAGVVTGAVRSACTPGPAPHLARGAVSFTGWTKGYGAAFQLLLLTWSGMARAARSAECLRRLRAMETRVLMLIATCTAASAAAQDHVEDTAAAAGAGDEGRPTPGPQQGDGHGDNKETAPATTSPLATPPPPPPPEVLPPPRDQESVAVQEGDDVTFTLHLAGGEPTDYYW
ncbi:Unconventional myosin-VIIb [Frankliniella fusca]|uniref:Unconventional myosin-VIIb n=1 Tax=Frankliniella fusca TaxID=407009 RepID=A0AAE1LIU3_9NEOP|nr:Unconventional myosin-VIIb [Frankliniella fusca]